MPNITNNNNRQIVPADFEQTVVELWTNKRQAPSVAIDASPTRQICINVQWFPYLLSALDALASWWLWQDQIDDASRVPQEWERLIYNAIINACEGVEVLDCEQLNDCLEQSDEYQRLVNTIINNNIRIAIENYGNQDGKLRPVPQVVIEEQPLDILPDAFNVCTNDNAYASADAFVSRLEAYVLQAFETVEALTNIPQTIADFVDALPIIGTLQELINASDIVTLLTNLDNLTKENWEASYTPAIGDELRCIVFNVIACQDGCTFFWQQILDAIREKVENVVGETFNLRDFGTLLDSFENLFTGQSPVVAYGVIYLYLDLIFRTSWVPGALDAYYDLQQAIQTGRDDENNDWSIECGAPACLGQYVWLPGEPVQPWLQYVTDGFNYIDVDNNVVFREFTVNSSGDEIVLFFDEGLQNQIERVYVRFTTRRRTSATGLNRIQLFTSTADTTFVDVPSIERTFELINDMSSFSLNTMNVRLQIALRGDGQPTAFFRLEELRIDYNGNNPFVVA